MDPWPRDKATQYKAIQGHARLYKTPQGHIT